MDKYVIIVAGGKGTRMGSEIPKQFLLLNQEPILMHTIRAFYNWNNNAKIIVVLPVKQIEYWEKLVMDYEFDITHDITTGGATRFNSVSNGLKLVSKNSLVAIHDAVRPLVSEKTINNVFEMAIQKGNGIPFEAVVDSMRIVKNGKNQIVNRSELVKIQTPQAFQSNIIKKAFEVDYEDFFTDDASVLEHYGETINLVPGNPENIKITSPKDLKIAEIFIS